MPDQPHLAYQLRRLADTLATNPHRNDTQRAAEQILTAGILLWTAGHTALTRTAQWSGPWPTGDTGPTGKGTHSDPTQTSALEAVTHTDHHPERRYHQRLTTAIGFTVDNAIDITHVITATLQRTKAERPTDECSEPRCTDTAEPGRKGRCAACAKWRQRWLASHPGTTNVDVPPVPADVIDDRRIRRRRRPA